MTSRNEIGAEPEQRCAAIKRMVAKAFVGASVLAVSQLRPAGYTESHQKMYVDATQLTPRCQSRFSAQT